MSNAKTVLGLTGMLGFYTLFAWVLFPAMLVGCIELPKTEPVYIKYDIVRIEGTHWIDVYYLDSTNTVKKEHFPHSNDTETQTQIKSDVSVGEPCYMEVSGEKWVGLEVEIGRIIKRKLVLHIHKSDLGKYLEEDALTCIGAEQ